MFEGIRKSSLGILLGSVIVFTITSIAAIWEYIQGEFAAKSLWSLVIIAGTALVIIVITLERDKKWVFSPQNNGQVGGGWTWWKVVGGLIFLWLFLMLLSEIF